MAISRFPDNHNKDAMPSHILIVESPYYKEITDFLIEGAVAALGEANATYERVCVPGALEIPLAIKIAHESGLYDGFIALGCVLRGETSHYDIVCNESASGLSRLGLDYNIAIGNGILTCENEEQALVRARPDKKNKGRDAALAALAIIDLKNKYKERHATA